jgi:hypothetical protein
MVWWTKKSLRNTYLYTFEIDYTFLSNCITAQTQMDGSLGEHQYLLVTDVETDEDGRGVLTVSCTLIEEKAN